MIPEKRFTLIYVILYNLLYLPYSRPGTSNILEFTKVNNSISVCIYCLFLLENQVKVKYDMDVPGIHSLSIKVNIKTITNSMLRPLIFLWNQKIKVWNLIGLNHPVAEILKFTTKSGYLRTLDNSSLWLNYYST